MSDNQKTKENVYDEEIAPLMAQIIEVCKRAKIPMLATFSIPNQDDPDLLCSTILLDKEWNPPDHFWEVKQAIVNEPVFIAFTISKGNQNEQSAT